MLQWNARLFTVLVIVALVASMVGIGWGGEVNFGW
jgi:hypothetical protein